MNETPDASGRLIDDGPSGWRVWRAALAGVPSADGWESLLYSDAYFVGEITEGLGPFQVFSTMAAPLTDVLAPRLAVRTHWRDAGPAPKRSKTKIKQEGTRWLALDVDEEFACLLSLITGCRMRSGGKTRRFSTDDPAGRPMFAEHIAPVALVPAFRVPMIPRTGEARLLLPAVAGQLSRYPQLNASDAVALVRAAKHYTTALWVADSDPEQAWIQLVSSVEAVATQWKTTKSDPASLFADHFPEPARIIKESSNGDELLANVAPYFARLIGATKRFEDFIVQHRPAAPPVRPPNASNGAARVDWNNIRAIVRTIYKHRSELLHSGVPFPADLCVPPLTIDTIPEERPLGISSTVGNTIWKNDETPIRLHTFAYLAQGCIVNWWNSTTSKQAL